MPRVEASAPGKEGGKLNVAPELYSQRQEKKTQRYSCILEKCGIKKPEKLSLKTD